MTEPRRTELGQHIKGKGVGITYIFLGIFGALASLSLYGLFPVFAIIFVIIGIIILFSGIAILSTAAQERLYVRIADRMWLSSRRPRLTNANTARRFPPGTAITLKR